MSYEAVLIVSVVLPKQYSNPNDVQNEDDAEKPTIYVDKGMPGMS